LLYNTQASTRSLYIHWPFCPYKCHFCPFVALAGHDQFMERYHKALSIEIECFARECDRQLPLDTIYIGGGTPSTYPDALLLDMFGILKRNFVVQESTEVTIEVNPGTVRIEQLALWKELGINRLSIGVQSLKDTVLHDLNRIQSVHDVYFVIEHASKVFDNLSADLIIGLPGVTPDEWKELLSIMVTLPLQHLSMYFLTVHEDTALYSRVQKKRVVLPCDDTIVDLYYWSIAFLAEHGFEQYEISNFARRGYHSRHNTMYWERKPYKAFGIGACSFDGKARFQNDKNLVRYMETIESGTAVPYAGELLTRKQIYTEKVMLGIRRNQGFSLDDALHELTDEERTRVQEHIVRLKDGGFVVERERSLMLTPRGLSVENEIAVQLTQ
jgi:oxygen-independent coproporphyrinogen-3 oxidase